MSEPEFLEKEFARRENTITAFLMSWAHKFDFNTFGEVIKNCICF